MLRLISEGLHISVTFHNFKIMYISVKWCDAVCVYVCVLVLMSECVTFYVLMCVVKFEFDAVRSKFGLACDSL